MKTFSQGLLSDLNHCMNSHFLKKLSLKCMGKADFCIQNFWLYGMLQLLSKVGSIYITYMLSFTARGYYSLLAILSLMFSYTLCDYT